MGFISEAQTNRKIRNMDNFAFTVEYNMSAMIYALRVYMTFNECIRFAITLCAFAWWNVEGCLRQASEYCMSAEFSDFSTLFGQMFTLMPWLIVQQVATLFLLACSLD